MFKKILKSFGVGLAKIDTRLVKDTFTPGEMIEGEVRITGGSAPEEIESLYLKIFTTYNYQKAGDGDYVYTKQENYALKTHWILERFSIGANEEKTVPFSVQLPLNTPVTNLGRRKQRVWLATTLDTEDSDKLDPKDSDQITVRPLPIVDRVLRAVERVGFELYDVDVEGWEESGSIVKAHKGFPFYQEFEFRPVGEFQGKLKELEIYFNQIGSEEVEVKVEFEKRKRGNYGGYQPWGPDKSVAETYTQYRLTEKDFDEPSFAANIRKAIRLRKS